MPWQKKFDEATALDAAMRLFWEKGYEATSFADIVMATKASRYGLYEVFGDKRDLFLKSIDHYQNTVIGNYVSELQEQDASLAAIHAYFARLLEVFDRPEIRHGCLMVTAAMELGTRDTEIQKRIHAYFDWLTERFENALIHAIQKGEMPSSLLAHETAVYLTGLVQGGAVFARSAVPKAVIETYFRTGLQTLSPER